MVIEFVLSEPRRMALYKYIEALNLVLIASKEWRKADHKITIELGFVASHSRPDSVSINVWKGKGEE